MTTIRLISTLLFLTVSGYITGQDTTIYRQTNAHLYWNHYTFFKKNVSDNFGTFFQFSGSDNLQIWKGQGVFTETKKKFNLTFDTSLYHNRLEAINSKEHKDTLYIKCFDWFGQTTSFFSIRFADTSQNNHVYEEDFLTNIVKIPKNEFTSNHLSLFSYGSIKKIYDFFVLDSTNEIHIFANNPLYMRTFNKKVETLHKNRKGFKTIGMFTRKRRAQFRLFLK
ncbi:MAG: hypothetical protein HYZ42_15930 [Bacteroidetes bacterium]|nr:hypothetical protein [Bacteroidota bacterium]